MAPSYGTRFIFQEGMATPNIVLKPVPITNSQALADTQWLLFSQRLVTWQAR